MENGEWLLAGSTRIYNGAHSWVRVRSSRVRRICFFLCLCIAIPILIATAILRGRNVLTTSYS